MYGGTRVEEDLAGAACTNFKTYPTMSTPAVRRRSAARTRRQKRYDADWPPVVPERRRGDLRQEPRRHSALQYGRGARGVPSRPLDAEADPCGRHAATGACQAKAGQEDSGETERGAEAEAYSVRTVR